MELHRYLIQIAFALGHAHPRSHFVGAYLLDDP